MNFRIVLIIALAAGSLAAQLTPEQKALDLQTIASLYAKQYAAYEWKRDNLAFDLFDLRPWLDRARASKTDLEYLDLVTEYISSLQDTHSYYIANSDFIADLHLYTDIYDGKVLVEYIDRTYLPASRYDFAVGDEIVLFDGKPVSEVVDALAKLTSFSHPRSRRRWAADLLVYRDQTALPSSADLADSAVLVVRRQDGSEKSYTIPWDKSGTPLRTLGPLPNLRLARQPVRAESPTGEPSFRSPWLSLQRQVNTRVARSLRGFEERDPIYQMPAGFTQRLGRNRADYFYSGTYTLEGKRIGLIRIGSFQPVGFGSLLFPTRQFEQEIGFMKANTDVLIVDITRNPGGYGCYAEDLERYLIPRTFSTAGVEIRPNLDLVREWEFYYLDALDFGTEVEAKIYASLLRDLRTAYSENRGRTGTIPLCSAGLELEPVRDRNGVVLAYDKPILLLTDEFSTSAADSFAAVLQDSGVAKLFGYRTVGAGGNTVTFQAGFFSEGSASISQMMTVRPKVQSSPGFPASRYIENVGVSPDIEYDFQTRENLIRNGAPFVDSFLRAAAALASARN